MLLGILALLLCAQGGNAAPIPPGENFSPADQEAMFLVGLGYENITPFGASTIWKKCQRPEGYPLRPEFCAHGEILEKNHKPIDQFSWSDLSARAVFFGEMHLDLQGKAFMKAHLKDLAAQGFGAVGLEMFNVTSQDVLDRYFNDAASLEEVATFLSRDWGYGPGPYIEIVAEAKRQGMRVIALDNRDSFGEMDFYTLLHARDKAMAQVLAERLARDPSLRVAIFCGQLHAMQSFSKENLVASLPTLLRNDYGFSTNSVMLYGAKDRNALNSLAKAVEGDSTAFTVALPKDYGYGEYLIFIR